MGERIGHPSRWLRRALLAASIAACLLSGGCSSRARTVSDYKRDEALQNGPWILATPNPVNAGRRGAKTMLIWDTNEGFPGQVFVSVDRRPERFVSANSHYYHEYVVQRGHTYEFRLYGSSRTSPLSTVQVTVR